MATRPLYIPLRLYVVETQHDGIRPMFMSSCWGLIADIGEEAEKPVAGYKLRYFVTIHL